MLSLLGGGAAVVGGGKAVDNVFIGYGVLVGTNLKDEDLEKLARARFGPSPFDTTVSGTKIRLTEDAVRVSNDDQRAVPLTASPDTAASADADFGLDGHPVEHIVTDLADVREGKYEFEFMDFEPFFDRVPTEETHPFTVEALRGNRFSHVPPSTIENFSGVSPKRPRAVLEGLVSGFREHTYYDIPRYIAGSVEDNVLFGTVDLRKYFKSPITYGALESGENAGMFCYEFTWRSIEALHSMPAHRQRTPVMGAMIYDDRHKHVYTGVASAVRRNGKLVIPMTFVDYTHSTLYDDLHLRWLLGRGMKAYDDRHRATEIHWQP